MTTNPQSRRPDPQSNTSFTLYTDQPHNLNPQSVDYIIKNIDKRIRQHEIRVAIISSSIGLPILLGIFHAIYLLNNSIPH